MSSKVSVSRTDDFFITQIPALQLLVNLGFDYLSPAEAAAARGGKASNVLLEEILRGQLKKLNRIRHKGETFHFSEANVQSAIQKLKNIKYDGLLKTNEAIHDLLTLGVALEQPLEGTMKSFTLAYIDWRNPRNNVFHVTAEFPVERTRSYRTRGADIVVFVNGIPFVVIQCRSPREAIDVGIADAMDNQRDECIPRLFAYAQLAMAVNRDEARYGTIGAPAHFWTEWKEDIDDSVLAPLLSTPLPDAVRLSLFDMVCQQMGTRQDATPYSVGRPATAQDRAIYALVRPERLLDLVWRFTIFDHGTRKIARHQQFFAVHKALETIGTRDAGGRRNSGIVWHAQGSGKSLTMIMLARALMLEPGIADRRVVVVTDRFDLDKQLGNTFAACGLTAERAETGKHLLELASDQKAHVITTSIQRFDKTVPTRKSEDTSTEIFLLVDENHRAGFGAFATQMRQMFPRACYVGFTGTPLTAGETANFPMLGELIDSYPIRQAVEDGAVVPLLYESRQAAIVLKALDKRAIDNWFRRHAQGLTPAEKSELRKKYGRMRSLDEADRVIFATAFDISEHFRENYQGLAKGLLVAPGKRTALLYKQYLDEIGHITSEVVISAPQVQEGIDAQCEAAETTAAKENAEEPIPAPRISPQDAATAEDPAMDEVHLFWQRMMKRYGSEEEYDRQIAHQYRSGAEPNILIVVDKFLTGFDAPRTSVLYLTRPLHGHALLQAMARVNRLHGGNGSGRPKEFGFVVDYAGTLGELDKALTGYDALAEFEEVELQGTLLSIDTQTTRLPLAFEALWNLFDGPRDAGEEVHERMLVDASRRDTFYERLAEYAAALAIALSSDRFMASIQDETLAIYKGALLRFQSLKASVTLRYQEHFADAARDAAIAKLLHTHVVTDHAVKLHEPASIFNEAAFAQLVEAQGLRRSPGAQADLVAHATKRAILDCHREDPAFYGKLSAHIRQAMEDYGARRISETEYLLRADAIRQSVIRHRADGPPIALSANPDAAALFVTLKPLLAPLVTANSVERATQAALDIWAIFMAHRKVCYWSDFEAQRLTLNAIDDYLYDVLKGEHGLPLSTAEIDVIIGRCMEVARARIPE